MRRQTILLLALLAGLVTVTANVPRAQGADAEVQLSGLADVAREKAGRLDFDAFRDATTFLPETGKYYVSGDTPIRNEKLLREFWDSAIRRPPGTPAVNDAAPEFVVAVVGGIDQIWGAERHALTYCVSDAFGSRQASVIAAMTEATAAWQQAADVSFVHVAAEDRLCAPTNPRVLFDMRPVNTGGQFLAVAFLPNEPRASRSLVIDPSAFVLTGNLSLVGVLRHELGHVLGGRHEHTRPEAGTCFEDGAWRGVSDYDAFSVMHYPQCNGRGDWSLSLTAADRSGIACLYGPAEGFVIDPAICAPPGGPRPQTDRFGPQDLAARDMVLIGNFAVAEGTPFLATMTGAGDPDLFIKVDGPALLSNYDCRPFESGPNETCAFDVPAEAQFVQVAVHGYTGGSFDISITHTPRPTP